MKPLRLIILISFILIIFSCIEEEKGTKLAKVYEKTLYLEDLSGIFPENISAEDSIMFLKNKIDLWVRKQSMLRRAELHLEKDQDEIDRIVEEYRSSLIIEKYKQEYIKDKIDTVVLLSELESYYNNYPESFILENDIVKAKYYKLNADNKHLIEFKNLFYSSDPADKNETVEFSKKNANAYNDFDNKWIETSVLADLLPANFQFNSLILNAGNKIETRNNDFYFFINIENYRLKGQKIPFEQVKDRIKTIVLNKRKSNLINELEYKIYQNDLNNGNIKIYVE
jgi:hypothetical protein